MTSMEVSAELGHFLLEAYPGLSVDVHSPQEIINVEIRKVAYIYSITIPGPGGLPVGTNGKGMALLSGGIDSPVAAYMIAKRGVVVEAVYFHAPPFTSERAKQKVIDLACLVADYAGAIKLHVVNFADGTYETSILPYEDCCTTFVAKHPVTKPVLSAIEKSEEKLAGIIEPLYRTAVDTAETVMCRAKN